MISEEQKLSMEKASREESSFLDIFDEKLLSKVHNAYDEYMNIGDFSVDIFKYILKDVTENEILNYKKIMRNLEFQEEAIDWQHHFLLMNSAVFHTTDLMLNNPEKITINHKMALYAMDMFNDMQGEEDYPHTEYVDQLMEVAEMKVSPDFIESVWKVISPGYLEVYEEFLRIENAKNLARYK